MISHVAVRRRSSCSTPSRALVAADPIPIPYARSLEDATLPNVERIAAAVRAVAAA